jgi:hypothetical protein
MSTGLHHPDSFTEGVVLIYIDRGEWIVTNIFLRFFENSSDELGTGNTRHFRLQYKAQGPIVACVANVC